MDTFLTPSTTMTLQEVSASWNLPLANSRVLVNGYQSWSEAELRSIKDKQRCPKTSAFIKQGHDIAYPPSGHRGTWRSHTMIAVLDEEGGWVGCALNAKTSFTHWEATQTPQGVRLDLQCEGTPEPVRLAWSKQPIALIEELAAELGKNMDARIPQNPPRVWCSWYYYYRDITAESFLENAHQARALDLPFDVFQLDDGYQADIGDWLSPNPNFHGHPQKIAEQIQELGFVPGLWIAPFIACPTSHLFQEHPEWFLRDAGGKLVSAGLNWGGDYYALDTTLPPVQKWLENLAHTLRSWGFRYLKLDFLFAAALPGQRGWKAPAAPQANRIEAYRQGLACIRRGAPDAFLLGCGAPLAASIGLVDAMRTGPDVAPYWDDLLRRHLLQDGAGPSTRGAVSTCLSRWYQRHWFLPDPDVIIARSDENCLTPEERYCLLGLLEVIGGLRANSDPLSKLSDDDLKLLRKALEISTPQRPLSLKTSLGPAPTHFPSWSFNLEHSPRACIPAHSARKHS